MLEGNSSERRGGQRISHSEPVQFQINEQAAMGGSLSKDISQGGIRLRLSEFLPLGTHLGLQLYLSPDRVVECSGRVVWISQIPHSDYYYAGLQFDDESVVGEVKDRIQEFIVTQKKPRFKFS
jgi:c-di-GMP-binding flagellar brake protein YcgR